MDSRELDEPSALRWMGGRNGIVSLWLDGEVVSVGALLDACSLEG